MQYYDVLLPLIFDYPFTYKAEGEINIGQMVKVPFRNRMLYGIVIGKSNVDDKDNIKIKDIIKILDFHLRAQELEFIKQVASYNIAPLGSILKQVLPQSVIAALDRKDWQDDNLEDEFAFAMPILSDRQQEIVDKIVATNSNKVHVIDGETGSGKTEVYLLVAKNIIEQGKQVLVLLPEIMLTKQLLTRFEERLGSKPIEWHSGLTPKQKRENFMRIISGKGKFIVGARSALFMPFHNLGLIVIDEEHDKSFKQEEGVIYNARDMAILKAKVFNIPALLCSATLSLETYYNIQKGKYLSYKLDSRFGGSVLPETVLVDLNKDKLSKDCIISKGLYMEMLSTLKKGKQILLFLNKRGFAPVIHCGECQTSYTCRNCNALMVYHKFHKKMLCHYCGLKRELISKCTICESENLLFLGTGVEKLEEEVMHLFPSARVITLTSDTKENGNDISKITNKEVDIIIGTQILAKGLHFPDLHLVAVVDAESNMLGFDIRALERTYQLMHQVAGRAGRMQQRGKVVIQTTEPNNPVIKHLLEFDQKGFMATELKAREVSNMPPFTKLTSINITSYKDVTAASLALEIKKLLPQFVQEIEVIGPSPAPLYFLRNQYRYRILIKTAKNISINNILKKIQHKFFGHRAIKVTIDVDPQNFL